MKLFIYILFLCTVYSCKSGNTHPVYGGDEEETEEGCGYEDGLHDATVEYTNPETGYSNMYSLEVEVEGCEVTTIYFPKGGWMDDSHISPTELNSDGSAIVVDDRGREFSIQID